MRVTIIGFNYSYDKLEDFHPYPDALKGGTILLVTDETMTLDEFKEFKDRANLSKEEKKKLAEKEKQQKQKEKEKLKKEKMKEAKKRKKLKDAGVYDIAYDLSINPAISKHADSFSFSFYYFSFHNNSGNGSLHETILGGLEKYRRIS